MSMMEMYVTDSLFYNAERRAEDLYVINLSNGRCIFIEKNPFHNGEYWAWRVDDQIFSNDEHALEYLRKLVAEKLTGIRVINHRRYDVPDICGVDGRRCRAKNECNRALCDYCPVAEEFFAKRDGVKLVYAV